MLGNVQVNAGRYEEGFKLFNEVLKVNAKASRALIGRGSIYALKSMLDEAILDFSRALDVDPSNKDAMTRLGQVNETFVAVTKIIERYFPENVNIFVCVDILRLCMCVCMLLFSVFVDTCC